jgi:hypothetical protein
MFVVCVNWLISLRIGNRNVIVFVLLAVVRLAVNVEAPTHSTESEGLRLNVTFCLCFKTNKKFGLLLKYLVHNYLIIFLFV